MQFIKLDLLNEPELDLQPEDDVLTSGLISSMAVFRLIDFLEQTFAVQIPPADMTIDHFFSVAAMGDYVRSRQSTVPS